MTIDGALEHGEWFANGDGIAQTLFFSLQPDRIREFCITSNQLDWMVASEFADDSRDVAVGLDVVFGKRFIGDAATSLVDHPTKPVEIGFPNLQQVLVDE